MKLKMNQPGLAISKKAKVIFWITTGIIFLETAVGSYWDIARIPFVMDVFKRLGYPAYFLTFMGIWKLLGVIAFFIPRFPRIKELIYAGLFFTYSGAVFSHAAIGEYSEASNPLIFVGLTIVSWSLYPKVFRSKANRSENIQVGKNISPLVSNFSKSSDY